MKLLLVLYLLISFAISFLLTPVIRKFALKINAISAENHRTVHSGRIPRLGGTAIVIAIVLTTICVWIFHPQVFVDYSVRIIVLLFGVFILFLLGALDDIFDLNCNVKIVVEIAIAALAVASGWKIDLIPQSVELHFDADFILYPLSILWIAGIINAFNMIDGLDGLAASLAIVISFLLVFIAIGFGNYYVCVMAIILAGSLIGFLRYNLFPAIIFMGDSGSLPVGFLLACLTVAGTTVSLGFTLVHIPVFLLAVPIADTVFAIFRRLKKGIHPFHADQEHIHHRLVKSGKSQNKTVLLLAGLTIIFGVVAFLLVIFMENVLS